MSDTIKIPFQKGYIRGRVCRGVKSSKYYSFQGIPYAEPPVGELRFKAPVPIKERHDVLDATREAAECYQRHQMRMEEITGDEDCLYLNVYTPQVGTHRVYYPVMVWIHGGAFVCGSSKSELYGPVFLLSQHIVLVSFNYRIGLLGFVSFKDARVEVPGNAGLKDQVLVLHWIQQNIAQFNGDKSNVTLFGQDAGAACVHLHMLSSMSQGLFHKAILQSGSALNPWVNGILGTGKLIAKALGIEGDENLILKKLRLLSVEELYKAQEILTNENSVNVKWFCSPVIEKQTYPEPFLTDEPINIITSGNYAKLPMVIGYTSREGIYWDLYNKYITGHSIIITDFAKVIPNNLNVKKGSLLSKTIADKIRNFYYGPRMQQTRMGRYPRLRKMDPLYQLITDVFFLRGIFATIRNHLENSPKTPIYYYKFTYETELNVYKHMLSPAHQRKYKGAVHGDDLNYIFNRSSIPTIVNGSAEEFAVKKLVKLWTHFAKTGSPCYATSLNWFPVTKENFQCLNISEECKTEYNPDMDRMHFWKDIYVNDNRTKYL